jgi:hypothetical protein
MLFGVAHTALAQAFVPPKGEVSVSVIYQDVLVKKHMNLDFWANAGTIKSRNLGFDVSVGLGHKLAVSATLPFTATKYTGDKPHVLAPGEEAFLPAFQPVDNGVVHTAAQDFRFDVRYNLTSRGVILTPVFTMILPSHDYAYFGHAAVGHGYREAQFGVYAARVFHPWRFLPTAFVQGRYAIGLEEKILNISRTRHTMGFEGGYFLTERLRLFAMGSKQITHGGLDFIVSPRADNPAPSQLFVHHDQLARENFLNLGGGAGFTLSNRVELFGSAVRTVSGINGHAMSHLVTVGLTYSFSLSRRSQPKPAADDVACHEDPNDPANALAKCVCLKK